MSTALKFIAMGIITISCSVLVFLDAKGIIKIVQRPNGREHKVQKRINIIGMIGSYIFMVLGLGILVLGILFVIF